jgi:CBS domain-containing protein
MGQHTVDLELSESTRQAFMMALLEDLRALEYMLEHDLIESGIKRVGAEQEMFLVDQNLRPAPFAVEVLRDAHDPRLTSEIARFNLEANLAPQKLEYDCFSRMESELQDVLQVARRTAKGLGADILLAGILPTLKQSDLTLQNITPNPRYFQLNQSITGIRGGPFNIHIKGLDEVQLSHDNIMMESCNTSFQVHLQVSPKNFANRYNFAQAITAPVVACAVNSPLLFGNRLWHETRLALFQHSTDMRSPTEQVRSLPTRVGFGERWLEGSILNLFYDQISRFRAIMTSAPEENPFAVLARGELPPLSALCLHNGTIWPWNRACYGVNGGKAHLRIENRALPSGPTTTDEIANAAFFVGLMIALPEEYGDITRLLKFDQAKQNFFVAARYGLGASLDWVGGTTFTASDLLLNHLLPLARQGLKHCSVDTNDIDHYLGVVEERVASRQTGAQWMLDSFASMNDKPREFRTRVLAEEVLTRQKTNEPVHRWPVTKTPDLAGWIQNYQTVGQFMSTDLFTMRPDDLVDLAASLMNWRHIRHVPVEDNDGQLVGLISHRSLLRLIGHDSRAGDNKPVSVRDIMRTDPVTVSSTTSSLEAIDIMRRNRIGCLPVVDDGRLVGIVTSYDFLDASAKLFERELRESVDEKKSLGKGASSRA